MLVVTRTDQSTVLLHGGGLVALLLQDSSQSEARTGVIGFEPQGLLVGLDCRRDIAARV